MRQRIFRSAHTSRPGRRRPSRRFRPVDLTGLELLDRRVLPAVTATFSAAQGVLTVMGDDLDNSIAVSRHAAGTLVVNGDGGIVTVQGGPATAANTRLIQIFGLGGNDNLTWARTANLPAARIDGGTGDDVITSGSGNDTLVGGAGNDTYLFDTDAALGSDTIDESGGGIDTLDFSSTNTRAVSIDLSNPAAQVVNAGLTLTLSAGNTIENAIGGDLGDTITGNALNNVITGGAGNDTIAGGAGNDVLVGGDGDDVLTGGAGNDRLAGGAGNDTFVWNPGDGNDTVEGQDGNDKQVFRGDNVNESIALSANGTRARLTRDVGGVTMDLNGLEVINVIPMGGADTITVNDLSGTGVRLVNLPIGPTDLNTGDGQADTVVVNGTNGNDNISLNGSALGTTVLGVVGLSPQLSIINAEAIDHLTVNALGGDDTVDASGLPANLIGLRVNGGAGNDTVLGTLDADGFEAPAVGAGSFRYDPTGTPWTFAGSAGIAGNGSGFTAGNPNAPEGAQVAFLQGTGSFSQAVTNLAAGTYRLTFQAAQRANVQASRQDFRVLVDGAAVGTFMPAGTAYSTLTTAAFTVAAGAHTISFQGLDSAGGDNTAFVDDVQLTQ
jgi:Ca2+-binding RTX toxin-like protein